MSPTVALVVLYVIHDDGIRSKSWLTAHSCAQILSRTSTSNYENDVILFTEEDSFHYLNMLDVKIAEMTELLIGTNKDADALTFLPVLEPKAATIRPNVFVFFLYIIETNPCEPFVNIWKLLTFHSLQCGVLLQRRFQSLVDNQRFLNCESRISRWSKILDLRSFLRTNENSKTFYSVHSIQLYKSNIFQQSQNDAFPSTTFSFGAFASLTWTNLLHFESETKMSFCHGAWWKNYLSWCWASASQSISRSPSRGRTPENSSEPLKIQNPESSEPRMLTIVAICCKISSNIGKNPILHHDPQQHQKGQMKMPAHCANTKSHGNSNLSQPFMLVRQLLFIEAIIWKAGFHCENMIAGI